MSSYATANTPEPTNVVANARLYWRISAPVVGLVAVLGFLMNVLSLGGLLPGFLEFDFAHNVVHLLIAGAGLYLGYSAIDYAVAKGAAALFGVVYLALALVGFISGSVFGIGNLLGLHLELGENLIHVALGAWAAYAGFAE